MKSISDCKNVLLILFTGFLWASENPYLLASLLDNSEIKSAFSCILGSPPTMKICPPHLLFSPLPALHFRCVGGLDMDCLEITICLPRAFTEIGDGLGPVINMWCVCVLLNAAFHFAFISFYFWQVNGFPNLRAFLKINLIQDFLCF